MSRSNFSGSGRTAEDFRILGPIEPCDFHCLVEWDCVDLTARTENFRTYLRDYCGVGPRGERLFAIRSQARTQSTFTLRGPTIFTSKIIRELAKNGCPAMFQKVDCNFAGEAFRIALFTSTTSNGALTARGINPTNDTQASDVTGEYDSIVSWGPCDESRPVYKNTNGGYYNQAPMGNVDGVNDTFILDPAPYGIDQPYGFPITVYLNGVLQVEGVDYEIVGNQVVFTTPPPCPPEGAETPYIRVVWYTKEYLLFGLTPVSVWFCDSPSCGYGSCEGSRCSDGCRYFHALFRSGIPVPEDACGNQPDADWAIVATYEYTSGVINFIDLSLLDGDGIYNPVDGLCDGDGVTTIATQLDIYTGCGTGYVDQDILLPAASLIKQLAHSELTGALYALFGNAGVAMKFGERWVIRKPDTNAIPSQTSIDAAGTCVVTAGGNTVQYSSDEGKTWRTVVIPQSNETILDVGVGVPHELAQANGLIYILTTNGSSTYLRSSGDGGRTWVNKKNWTGVVPECRAQIEVAVDDWFIYVHIDGKTYRNTNYGCDKCQSWCDMSNPDADCNSHLVVCPANPATVIVVGSSQEFAVDDFYRIESGTITAVPLAVLSNDHNPAGCVIDVTSVSVVAPGPSQGTANVLPSGVIEYTPDVGATGTDIFEYTVEAICGDEVITDTATVRIDFFA